MQSYTLKVIDIKKETEDTITLCFKQPGLKKIKYQAGQYLTLIFRINGRRYIRPYSFSSSPCVDVNLELTVKRVPNGVVSNYINDIVKVGDVIEVLSPMGDFMIPETEAYQSVFLWGAGSGITPLMSILKYLLYVKPQLKVNLIYGNRNKENTIFHNAIYDLKVNFPNSFKLWSFYSQLFIDGQLPDVTKGRIDPQKVLNILTENEVSNSLHFICGPTGLKQSVKEALNIRGISKDNIFSEDFELVKNPKDFEDIETRNIKLIFQEKEHMIEVAKGKSILEVALDAGFELPYSCQTGNCSICKAVLNMGSLKMIGLSKERDDLNDNEYLLCCSHPLDNNVSIQI